MKDKEPVDHTAKRAAERRQRQAEALRANLKRRKETAETTESDPAEEST
jgi:hypothetical protein